LLFHECMLIRRCAWHRLYNGYPIIYGVAAWRPRGVQYTDGMCRRCAATTLRQWSTRPGMAPPGRMARRVPIPADRAGIAVAAVAMLVALGIVAMVRRDGARRAVSARSRAATRAEPETPRRYEWDGPAVSSARTGVAPRRKSKSHPSLACKT
jgi:hypothetical protein